MKKTCRINGRLLTLVLIFRGITGEFAISAVKGSTVQLVCSFRHTSSTGTLDWTFQKQTTDQPLYYSLGSMIDGGVPENIRKRLTVTGNHSLGEYNLNVSDIQESDQGMYKCITTSGAETHVLTVIVGPTTVTITDLTDDNKIPGVEGQDMTIRCTSTGGQPLPVVKLEILGSTYTGVQSVQNTFKPQRSNDDFNVTCQAGYADINYYPLTASAQIRLKLKPIITHIGPDTLTTQETLSLNVSCESTGSRPAASMYWSLGQQDITSNSTFQSNEESSTDTYKVTSNLKYTMDRRDNEKMLKCGAVNVAGSIERTFTLHVKYAPSVSVDDYIFTQTQSPRQIKCTLDSNPLVNTYTWQHKSQYGENIRNFSDNNLVLTLPTVPEDQRYQDTGEYVCTAENGIVGSNGQIKQTGSGYVTSNAQPVITSDNKGNTIQYGKFGKSTKVYVNVYSIPKYKSIQWFRGDTHLTTTQKYVTTEKSAIVKDVFYGVEVQLDGYTVMLTISDLQEADFTNYTLRLNYRSQFVQHVVTLESASAPETPSNFTITDSGETSIQVQWISGYDGGQKQTFFIEYHKTGSSLWKFQEIKTSYQFDTHNFYTLSGLQDGTSYDLRMYAKNKFNESQRTDIETTRTSGKESSTAIGGVIGGVAGGLVAVIAILIFIAFVILKRKKTGSGFPSKRTRSHSDSEVEEGLKDNVLYEGSESDGLKMNVLYQSAESDSIHKGPNAEYADVSKPHKKISKSSSDEYAEVQKQNDMYAEVDKKAQQRNVNKKKQKDKKKPLKSGKANGGAMNNNPDGEYANSGNPIGSMSDGAYSNTENQSAEIKKNDQGLEYADLTFGSKIPKGKQPVIHGDENRTIYSEVDHTKKAPPPPQESEYEETTIRHVKK